MKELLGCVSLLLLVVSASAETLDGQSPAIGDTIDGYREGMTSAAWGIAATLFAPPEKREWLLILAVLAFVALNVFLWTLPISQVQLFLVSVPLGMGAFAGFIWYVGR